MPTPIETERYIRFQLEHLTATNDHHTFEQICYRVAKRRLSSNITLATGPVSSGGDQGRDAESYYTRLPEELPGAGGFVGRATAEPLVVACTLQRDGIPSKIKADVRSICSQGSKVERVAFFSAQEIPEAVRHHTQDQVRERNGVELEIFDGQKISHLLAESDLLWVAQRFLDLPSHLIPDEPEDPQPDWYRHTLEALRARDEARLTPGALSEVRDGLRHATRDAGSRPDLPEWLEYMQEFIGEGRDIGLALRAQYEIAVAVLRGLGDADTAATHIRAFLAAAVASDSPTVLSEAATLLAYWGGAFRQRLATVEGAELSDWNEKLLAHGGELLSECDRETSPNRAAQLLSVRARLCLQPLWRAVDQVAIDHVASATELNTMLNDLAVSGRRPEIDVSMPMDVAGGMSALEELVELLPRARTFPIGPDSDYFQLLAPLLQSDVRYETIRDALDEAVSAREGQSALATRCRDRAMAFRDADRPLEALEELQRAKVNWWHGDTIRGSLLAMRLSAQIFADLLLPHAAKHYALAAAAIALASDDPDLEDIAADAILEAVDHAYSAGAWGDACGLARLAVLAHHALAEDAFDYQEHPELFRMDFHLMVALLASRRFHPAAEPVLYAALGDTGYEEQLQLLVSEHETAFTLSEDQFLAAVETQLAGPPFSDLGPERTLTFAALGTRWTIRCSNNRQAVLAAERFAAAAQILLVELAPGDPVLYPQDIVVDFHIGAPAPGKDRVNFKANNSALECSVILTKYEPGSPAIELNHELSTALVYLLTRCSALPDNEVLSRVEQAFRRGLLDKLHVAQVYDDIAGLLDMEHYDALAAVSSPSAATGFTPHSADELAAPSTPGPGYQADRSTNLIRENYQFLPTLVGKTLARVITDSMTAGALLELRAQGWLDWHLLVAIVNVAFNFRAKKAGVLLPGNEEAQRKIAHTPEDDSSEDIPLDEFTVDGLTLALDLALLSIGQRRWKLVPGTQTPNASSLRELLINRYGFLDDVPHLDLLTAVSEDGELLPLLSGYPVTEEVG